MFARILILGTILTVLVGLILYSQMRPQADFVSGVIESEEIRLGSRVGGRVSRVLVQEGDTVIAGTPLVEFEAYDLIEREQQAIAVLAERQAALDKMNAGMRPEEVAQAESRYSQAQLELSLKDDGPRPEEIAAADDRLTAARSELQLAEREFERVDRLFQSNAVSRSELDLAIEKRKVASSNVSVRNNELKILESGSREQEVEIARARAEELRLALEIARLGFRDEEKAQAAASRDAAAAALEVTRRQAGELKLVSPADGVIDALDLQPGDLVPANAPVITMLSANDVWVRAYVPQRFLQLQVGQELRVTVDSFPDKDFEGTVTFISHQAEFTPSNVQTPDDRAKQVYRIRVTLHGETALRSGMTANVWLDSESTLTSGGSTSERGNE